MFTRNEQERGVTMLELLVVLAIIAIVGFTVVPPLRELDSPSQDGALQFLSYVKRIRAEAVASTSALTVTANGTQAVSATSATNCGSATQTAESDLAFILPSGASFSSSSWTFCVDPLGLADQNLTLTISDDRSSLDVEIMLGGAVEVSN